jgi:hypothetical protein
VLVDRGAGAGGVCVVSGVKVEASQNGESGVVVLGCRAALEDAVCSFNGADGGAGQGGVTALDHDSCCGRVTTRVCGSWVAARHTEM